MVLKWFNFIVNSGVAVDIGQSPAPKIGEDEIGPEVVLIKQKGKVNILNDKIYSKSCLLFCLMLYSAR